MARVQKEDPVIVVGSGFGGLAARWRARRSCSSSVLTCRISPARTPMTSTTRAAWIGQPGHLFSRVITSGIISNTTVTRMSPGGCYRALERSRTRRALLSTPRRRGEVVELRTTSLF